MSALLIVACLLSNPDDCKTYELHIDDCARQGMFALPQWLSEHPDREIKRWSCGLIE